MKARLLKEWLYNTDYLVHISNGKVCIGTIQYNDLISIDIDTYKMRYCFKKIGVSDKDSINNKILLDIWNKLEELIYNGKIEEIIECNDLIEGMVPIYKVEDGKIIKQYSDKLEWYNITHDGELIREFVHFATDNEAIEYNLLNLKNQVIYYKDKMKEKRLELKKIKDKIDIYSDNIKSLNKIKREKRIDGGMII